jgi:hypothetical protein
MVPCQHVYRKSTKSTYGRHVEIILLPQIYDVEIISTLKVFVNAFSNIAHSWQLDRASCSIEAE